MSAEGLIGAATAPTGIPPPDAVSQGVVHCLGAAPLRALSPVVGAPAGQGSALLLGAHTPPHLMQSARAWYCWALNSRPGWPLLAAHSVASTWRETNNI